jgi:hypothetical protein
VDDRIDIGAFAESTAGKMYGDTLYRERIHITQRNSTFTFTTIQLPEKAGIDPFALLIDRIPNDNVKNVTLTSDELHQVQSLARSKGLPEASATIAGDRHFRFNVCGRTFGYLLNDHQGDGARGRAQRAVAATGFPLPKCRIIWHNSRRAGQLIMRKL